jgi:RNA polymerase sigma factor (sigma-70 family)
LTCVIAKRKATSLRRKLSAKKRDEGKTTSINKPDQDGKEIGDKIPSNENSPLTEVQDAERLRVVSDFINSLEGNIKEVIKLKFLKDFSNIEISKKLDMNPSTVGGNLRRGILKLTKEANKNPALMKLLKEFLR